MYIQFSLIQNFILFFKIYWQLQYCFHLLLRLLYLIYAQRGDNIQGKQLSCAEGSLSIIVDSKTNCKEIRMKAEAARPRQSDQIKTCGESHGLIVLIIPQFNCLIFKNSRTLGRKNLHVTILITKL